MTQLARGAQTATARASVVAAAPRYDSCCATERAIASLPASGRSPVRAPSSASTARATARTNSGFPPVARWHARPSSCSGARAELAAQQLAHPALAERRRLHLVHVRLGEQSLEQLRRVGLDRRARRCEQQHGQLVQPPREVGDEAHRGRVDPVQVVHRDEQWTASREIGHEPVEAVDGGACRVRAGQGRVAPAASDSQDRRGDGCRPLEELRGLGAACEQGVEELPNHAIGEVALELPAPGPQPVEAGIRCDHPSGVEQARLADPRRALDRHRCPAARGRRGGQLAQLRELSLPFDQHGRRVPAFLSVAGSKACGRLHDAAASAGRQDLGHDLH